MITAVDLLAQQERVADLQAAQQRAFSDISFAEKAVEQARKNYEEARWRAEEAAAELKELIETIRND